MSSLDVYWRKACTCWLCIIPAEQKKARTAMILSVCWWLIYELHVLPEPFSSSSTWWPVWFDFWTGHSPQSAIPSTKRRASSSNCWFNSLEEFRNFAGAVLQSTLLNPGCVTIDAIQERACPPGRRASLHLVLLPMALWATLLCQEVTASSAKAEKAWDGQLPPLSGRQHQDAWPCRGIWEMIHCFSWHLLLLGEFFCIHDMYPVSSTIFSLPCF